MEAVLTIDTMQETIQSKRERESKHLKKTFFLPRADLFIFTSSGLQLFKQLNEKNEFSQH